eukprot:gnl/TRDRNA2_/TRDRNA2_41863_c0_seq1.p1 gnl/TRDRNA2_/TRDRNA2_41863_c0~~gnl/TRDRNA2_/TRDRNA2_41863_c0_seq1.p1  ORF type:complete len:196 (-),score=63.04 gnl/TRDRNA2_/TRDRNA2_41863_c0_seq1:93-638(-)
MMRVLVLGLAALASCHAARTFLRNPPTSALKAELSEIQAEHTAAEDVIHRSDEEFKRAQVVLAEVATIAPNNMTALLKDLKASHTSLAQVTKDLKARQNAATALYTRLMKVAEDSDKGRQLLRNLQAAEEDSFKVHHRLAETFDFKFKRALHLITKAMSSKNKTKSMQDLQVSLGKLVQYA